jgi:hypothetical protein
MRQICATDRRNKWISRTLTPPASPPAEHDLALRHRLHPWKYGLCPSLARSLQVTTCKHLATGHHRTALHLMRMRSTRWISALETPGASPPVRVVPVTAGDRTANPPHRCRHLRGAVPPASRGPRLRDRFPGRLGVATETADRCSDEAATTTPRPGIGSRRSLPSILSVGHDRQPTSCLEGLSVLQQRLDGSLSARP